MLRLSSREARLAAWQRYESLPTPTTRIEGWRRLSLDGVGLADDKGAVGHGRSG